MTGTSKTIAEKLRGKPEGKRLECWIATNVLGIVCNDVTCSECHDKAANALADMIEAEKAELDKCIEVLESDREDYIEAVTSFGCWQMQIANMLDIPLAERNDSGEVQAKIVTALKERTKTEYDGVDVDALLKVADEISELVDIPPHKVNAVALSTARNWKYRIREAVKDAKPQLPEGVIWPRFEDGELARVGDEFQHDGETKEITRVLFYETRTWLRVRTETYYRDYEYLPSKPLKRPEPEVMDADGVPIKVGDTVWHIAGGSAFKVLEVCPDEGYPVIVETMVGRIGASYRGAELTHRKSDTQEAIDADAAKTACLYFNPATPYKCSECPKGNGEGDVDYHECCIAYVRDLLSRQRKLMGGE